MSIDKLADTFDTVGLQIGASGSGSSSDCPAGALVAMSSRDQAFPSNADLAAAGRPKTLVFCTGFSDSRELWNARHGRWLRAIRSSRLAYDAILIVDDGSPVLPDWPGLTIWTDAEDHAGVDRLPELVFHHFSERLGRRSDWDFPGWYRSFVFAGRFAVSHGFEKLIHIESDAFLISQRVQSYFNDFTDGWAALWCPRYDFAESALQVMAGNAVRHLAEFEKSHPQANLVHRTLEDQLPLDVINKAFKGDRYGEYLPFVPLDADYAGQIRANMPESYYRWMVPAAPGKAS